MSMPTKLMCVTESFHSRNPSGSLGNGGVLVDVANEAFNAALHNRGSFSAQTAVNDDLQMAPEAVSEAIAAGLPASDGNFLVLQRDARPPD